MKIFIGIVIALFIILAIPYLYKPLQLKTLTKSDLPKEGSRFDLPIAIAILVASQQIKGNKLSAYEFIGELSLSGEIRS